MFLWCKFTWPKKCYTLLSRGGKGGSCARKDEGCCRRHRHRCRGRSCRPRRCRRHQSAVDPNAEQQTDSHLPPVVLQQQALQDLWDIDIHINMQTRSSTLELLESYKRNNEILWKDMSYLGKQIDLFSRSFFSFLITSIHFPKLFISFLKVSFSCL